jgi:alpha-tubulin suppressor-like RCC1 family protein
LQKFTKWNATDNSSAFSSAIASLTVSCEASPSDGFPHFCDSILTNDNFNTSLVSYSLEESTCEGVSVDSAGKISGTLSSTKSQNCSFKLKSTDGENTLISNTVNLAIQPKIVFSFDKSRIYLNKGGTAEIVTLSLSSPAPRDADIPYLIQGTNGTDQLQDFNQSGTIHIPKGSTEVTLNFELPLSSNITEPESINFQLTEGGGELPPLFIGLSERTTIPQFQKVSTGSSFQCGISDGQLFCWGSNTYGQLGVGSLATTIAYFPEQVGASSTWSHISTGRNHACGINSGALYCWGRDTYEQLGNGGSSADVIAPEQIGVSTTWTHVSAGETQTCGINNGALYCWGGDSDGESGNGNGNGTSSNILTPEQIGASTTWSYISTGYRFACGIDNGNLYCWGRDTHGQIGNGASSSADVTAPEQIGGSSDWTTITTGFVHACGLDSGNLYCWGSDSKGQVGNGNALSTNVTAPEQIGASTSWDSIETGNEHTCGIDSGSLYCWGDSSNGQLGNGTKSTGTYIHSPEKIGLSSTWTEISLAKMQSSSSQDSTCGIDNGKLYCWGVGQYYGKASAEVVMEPEEISELKEKNWSLLSLGGAHTCGISDGALYCIGSNNNGQLGIGSSSLSNVYFFEKIGSSSSWSTISAGFSHTCGIDNGELYCWGKNDNGQIGNGEISATNVITPARVGTKSQWTAVSTGLSHSCGVNNGSLYCWGEDWSGQLGNGSASTLSIPTPEKIGVSTSWSTVSLGWYHSCGLNNGALYCWGYRGNGEVGNGTKSATGIDDPVQIGASTNWTTIKTSKDTTCGIDGGALYCWGRDWNGQVGNGNASIADVIAPEQIGSSTNWTAISTARENTCGIDDGRLYCWGSPAGGALGNNLVSGNVEAPALIGISNNWTKLFDANNISRCGINNGEIHCWGVANTAQFSNIHSVNDDYTPIYQYAF